MSFSVINRITRVSMLSSILLFSQNRPGYPAFSWIERPSICC